MLFQVRVGVFNYQKILTKISFVVFHIILKKQIEFIKRGTGEIPLIWGLIDMFLTNLNVEIVACILLGTFRSEDEDEYQYEFSVLSMRIRFGDRHFLKCACSEQKTRTRSRPRPPI